MNHTSENQSHTTPAGTDSSLAAGSCPALPAGIHTIRCVGDSITEGWGLEDPVTLSWPSLLEKQLPGIRFENYGSAGAAVQSFLPNAWENTLAARVAFSRPADLTLLFLGTNDAEQLTPRFGTEYRQLVKRLQTLGPVVAVIPPKTARPALNRRLERIRQDILTADIPVIDLWNVFVPLAADGMHPTALGQQEIVRHIACGLPRALGHCTPDCQDMTIH